ncbi:MAG: protein kinase [Thiomargarita sp.]|nr:protein kinase [Thiomargarita sp.]
MEEQEYRNALPRGFKLFEYQIDSVLGKPGGFGITYLAKDTYLEQWVAIKEYLPTDFAVREDKYTVNIRASTYQESFEWGLKCFIDEARVLAKFNHPSLVRVLRFFKKNGTAYMVMEYQKGNSLTEYLKERRILTEEELLSIVEPLLEGLKEMHKAGFLHRDIKPNNIYIRDDKTPVLLDFGSARFAVGQKSRSVTSIVTPGYAPLEQYDNEISDQGPWTDIYALGAVMYCAISSEPPPAATRRVMKDPIIAAVNIGKGKYNKNLLESIDWALKLSEEDRPQTVEQWHEKMLSPISPVKSKQNNRVKPDNNLLNIIYIGIICLLCIVTFVLWYQKEQTSHDEMQTAIERVQSEFKAKVAQEQEARHIAEQELSQERKARRIVEGKLLIEQKARKRAERDYVEMKALIIELQRFEPEAVDEPQTFSFSEKKYYDVTYVEINDVLNIREFPGSYSKVVGEIPPTETCIRYLGKYSFVKTDVWVNVQYKEVQGWVHSYYLGESHQECIRD